MPKGTLLTFEGLDGCGKSTQAALLQEWLISQKKDVLYIREPGGTDLGEIIRELLLDKSQSNMSARSELHLFLAARAQLCDTVIRPALQEGKFVICDRFIDSTLAYQGYGRGMDVAQLVLLNDLATGNLQPNLTFLLQLSVAQINERLNQRGTVQDRMEAQSEDFRWRVHQGYDALAEKYKRIKRIEADQAIAAIASIIQSYVKEICV